MSDSIIGAAWPSWWSDEADMSSSARLELRFSLARKLGLDPRSLLEDDDEPRFIWRDEARFKNLTTEDQQERAVLASFGVALGQSVTAATNDGPEITGRAPAELREAMLQGGRPFVALIDVLSLCWSLGIPVVHLRLFPRPQKRMAAMTVRTGRRWAILLSKDSLYPAHVAIYLAHAIGHIALGHVDAGHVLVDFEQENLHQVGDDDEERAADEYALALLGAAQYVLPRKIERAGLNRSASHAIAQFTEFVREAVVVEPTDEERNSRRRSN